jgi:hypothetical protein
VQPSHLNAFIAIMALGVLVGTFGHVMKSKPVILFGILLVGAVSTYFVIYTLVPGG